MRHVRPKELLLPERHRLWVPPRLFIPGLAPAPKIIGAIREVNPGSVSWTSPGTYYWSVPLFNTMTVTCVGAGGGGSGAGGYTYWYGEYNHVGAAGATGGYGQFYVSGVINLVAYGGTGGPGGATFQTSSPMAQSAHGQGYNGDSNYYGSGAAGGYYGIVTSRSYFYPDGQGGKIGGEEQPQRTSYGGYGGNGGRTIKNFTIGQVPQGSSAMIVVQGGGAAGWQTSGVEATAETYIRVQQWPVAGGAAAVYVSWS